MSVTEFARDHGLDLGTTYQVLAGRKKGLRGKAHKAAIALGIKAGVPASLLSVSISRTKL
nr:DNA-binding protein [Pseudomonas syringae group genomosp. 3]